MSDEAFYEGSLKLAYLWFDDIVMQSPGDTLLPGVLEKRGARPETIESVCEHIHSVQHYDPDYKPFDGKIWDEDAIKSAVTSETLKNYFEETYGPNAPPGEIFREVALTGAAVLDVLGVLNKLSVAHQATLMPTDFEHRVLEAMATSQTRDDGFSLFEEIAQFRLPRLQETSWDLIVDLRNHPYLENFRKMLSLAQSEAGVANRREIFSELERKSMKELLSLLKPSPISATAKGVLTNLPFPTIVNPFGILDSINTVRKELEIRKKFGWIYFLYDLDN